MISYLWKWKYALVSLLFFALAVFTDHETFDIAVHDTYFVIAKWYIFVGFGIISMLFSIIHFVMQFIKRPLATWGVAVHWFVSVVTIGFLLILTKPQKEVPVYEDYSIIEAIKQSENSLDINYWISFFIILLALAQVLFFSNIIHALFRKSISLKS